ncbi:unnamed protein product, partial [Sphenostylis stenocarpa]
MAIIQESCIDPLGSYVVYSPVNISDMKMSINGEESPTMSMFPSGIVISKDGRCIANACASSSANVDTRTYGSLLTVAFQILMNSPTTMIAESKTVVNSLMTSTVKNINHALIRALTYGKIPEITLNIDVYRNVKNRVPSVVSKY